MRRLLVVTVLLTLFPIPAQGSEQVETIRILVPASAETLSTAPTAKTSQSGWTRVEVPIAGGRAATLERIEANFGSDVVVEKVYHLESPSDEPMFPDQWGLENTGQTGGVPDADIDAEAAWSVSLGSGTVVAVVDSGIDATHPDLTGQIVPGWDTVDNDADTTPEGTGFDEAHGTMVAGIVAAAVNGAGGTGIAPETTILDIRACSGGECWSLDVSEAIFEAVDRGADIINLSLGSFDTEDPPMEAAIDYARLSGVVVVAAIGNQGLDVDNLPGGEIPIPAGLPLDNIIAVAASDDWDLRASYSNYGQTADVFAPGDFVLTTGTAGLDDYVLISGTSFAAPLVSGVAALLLSHDPGIGHHELIARLTGFADVPTGLDGLSKYGRINAGRALTQRFIDTSGSVFVNTIDWLAEQGITEGCNPPQNHRYCPGDHVTRGQMAVFFARAFDLPATDLDYFGDDEGAFYENSANRMAEAGITQGCAPDRYCGSRDISRGEMAAMIARALSLPSTENDHFVDDSGSTFEGAINRIAEVSITQGCNPPDNDRYCPTDDVNRGQMAAFLQRSVKLLD